MTTTTTTKTAHENDELLTADEAAEYAAILLKGRCSTARIRSACADGALVGVDLKGELGWRTKRPNVRVWVSNMVPDAEAAIASLVEETEEVVARWGGFFSANDPTLLAHLKDSVAKVKSTVQA